MPEPKTMQAQSWACTFFPDRKALSKTEGIFSTTVLDDPPSGKAKADLPYLKFAKFSGEKTAKGCYRFDKGIVAITGAEGDYDDEQLAPDKAAQRLADAGILAFVYTSPSHTEEKPRWRLLLPFSEEYRASTDDMRQFRRNALERAQTVLQVPLANESFTLSQGFIFGEVEGMDYYWCESKGEFIDRLHDLTLKPAVPAEHPLAGLGDNLQQAGSSSPDLWTQQILDGDAMHTAFAPFAAHLAAKGMPRDSAEAMVRGLMEKSQAKVTRPAEWKRWDGEVKAAFDSAYDKFGKPKPEDHGPKFGWIKAANREILPLDWQIDGILERAATSVLFGEPKIGKTFCVLDMCLSIAAGIPYHGKETKQTAVAYVAGEGQRSLDRRILAWCVARDIDADELPFFYSKRATSLMDASRIKDVVTTLQEAAPDAGLMVIDTLARNLGGSENDSDDINKMFDVIDNQITPHFEGLTKLIIAHPGLKEKNRPRGSAAIMGNCDAMMQLKAAPDHEDADIRLVCHFMKEAENFTMMSFNLAPSADSMVIQAVYSREEAMVSDMFQFPDDTVRQREARLGISKSAVARIMAKLAQEGWDGSEIGTDGDTEA